MQHFYEPKNVSKIVEIKCSPLLFPSVKVTLAAESSGNGHIVSVIGVWLTTGSSHAWYVSWHWRVFTLDL